MGRTKRKTRRSLKRRSMRSRRGGEGEGEYTGTPGFLTEEHHLINLKAKGSWAIMLGKRDGTDSAGVKSGTKLFYDGKTGAEVKVSKFNLDCDTKFLPGFMRNQYSRAPGERVVIEAYLKNKTISHTLEHKKILENIKNKGGLGSDTGGVPTNPHIVEGFKTLNIQERAEWLRQAEIGVGAKEDNVDEEQIKKAFYKFEPASMKSRTDRMVGHDYEYENQAHKQFLKKFGEKGEIITVNSVEPVQIITAFKKLNKVQQAKWLRLSGISTTEGFRPWEIGDLITNQRTPVNWGERIKAEKTGLVTDNNRIDPAGIFTAYHKNFGLTGGIVDEKGYAKLLLDTERTNGFEDDQVNVYRDEFVIIRNAAGRGGTPGANNGEAGSQFDKNGTNLFETDGGSMSYRHEFIVPLDTSFWWCNAALFGSGPDKYNPAGTLKMLNEMKEVALKWAENRGIDNPFFGFHEFPNNSLFHLHLHMIDLDQIHATITDPETKTITKTNQLLPGYTANFAKTIPIDYYIEKLDEEAKKAATEVTVGGSRRRRRKSRKKRHRKSRKTRRGGRKTRKRRAHKTRR